MTLWMKTAVFIIFLLVYCIWVAISYRLSGRTMSDLLQGKSFISSQLINLTAILGMFTLIWLLSGFINLELVGWLFILAQIGFVVTGGIWMVLGSPQVAWGARAIWAFGEFALKRTAFMLILLGFSVIVSLGYPIMAGIIYFRHTIPSEEATLLIFRLTFAGLTLSGMAFLFPLLISVLQSKNLDNDTRTRLFITQAGSLASYGLFLSLILWSFGHHAGAGYSLTIGTIPLTISPAFLLILITFFVCTLLLPYFVGLRKAHQWQKQLLSKELGWLDELLVIFELSNPFLHAAKLLLLNKEVRNEMMAFAKNDTMFDLSVGFDRAAAIDDIDPALQNIFRAYRQSRRLDPRFRYLDFLQTFDQELVVGIQALLGLKGRAEITQQADDFTADYRARRQKLTQELAQYDRALPRAWAGLAILLTPVVGQLLSEFGRWTWLILSQSL